MFKYSQYNGSKKRPETKTFGSVSTKTRTYASGNACKWSC